MFKYILCVAAALASVQALGEFVVLHSPDNLKFEGNEEIDQSAVKEVYTAALGYTVKQWTTWSGLSMKNPFNLPEAVVVVAVEGVNSLQSSTGIKFPLNVDEVEENTWQALSGRIEERDNGNTLVRISSGDGLVALGQSVIGELKPNNIDTSTLKALSLDIEEDRKHLEQVELLRAIAKKVAATIEPDSKPDVYWLILTGLHSVVALHGEDSAAAQEAFNLLNDALRDLCESFIKVYGSQGVLFTAFTSEEPQIRHKRAVPTSKDESSTRNTTDLNLSKDYNENYPVIFNIILWFGVAYFFALLAICITIAEMDPGRDSIIYRMTSNRMKKDN